MCDTTSTVVSVTGALLKRLGFVLFLVFCASCHQKASSKPKSAAKKMPKSPTPRVVPRVLSPNKSKEQKPIGYNRQHYYFLRNVHKRPIRHGPTAGWDLVIRKQDSCLLVIASSGSYRGKQIIEVRYKDKSGQWQGANSLSINDLPKASTALQKSYDYLLGSESEDAPGGPPGPEIEPASQYDATPEHPQTHSRHVRTVHKPHRAAWQ